MADDTRHRVLDAAGPIFARKGFEAATVREICTAADVNLASVNYHFGNKETLYLETVRLAQQHKLENVPLPELPTAATREQRLHGFVRTILTRLLGGGDGGWHTELLICEMIQPTHACKPLVEDYIRPQFNLLLEIVDEFVPVETSASERYQLAFSIVGQCLHYRVSAGFMSLLLTPDAKAELVNIDTLADQITRFSVAALSNLSPSPPTVRIRQRRRRTEQRSTAPVSR